MFFKVIENSKTHLKLKEVLVLSQKCKEKILEFYEINKIQNIGYGDHFELTGKLVNFKLSEEANKDLFKPAYRYNGFFTFNIKNKEGKKLANEYAQLHTVSRWELEKALGLGINFTACGYEFNKDFSIINVNIPYYLVKSLKCKSDLTEITETEYKNIGKQ